MQASVVFCRGHAYIFNVPQDSKQGEHTWNIWGSEACAHVVLLKHQKAYVSNLQESRALAFDPMYVVLGVTQRIACRITEGSP